MMFVQGGQTLIYAVGKTEPEQTLVVNTLGRKWELTFTTLATFGGAIFAAFPLFYSTSFGGAYAAWMLLLLCFILQAISYQFRTKVGNILGKRTYEVFLLINGLLGTVLLGVVVGTFFTGAPFSVEKGNLMQLGGSGHLVISSWRSPWLGLEALANPINVALGLAVFFLARTLGLIYFAGYIDNENIITRCRKLLLRNAMLFVLLFVFALVAVLLKDGAAVDATTGKAYMEPYKYLHNLLAMPHVLVLLLLGVVLLLLAIAKVYLYKNAQGRKSHFWLAAFGTACVVLSLLLCAGYNHTAFYPSTYNLQDSLTIYNSSSSPFTLKVMAVASIIIPFVVGYIAYVWHAMSRKKISLEEVEQDEHSY
jgi:cytochrome d ubiquinol oxidase subunit II